MQQTTLNFIGHISTPYKSLSECPHQPKTDHAYSIITINSAYISALQGVNKLKYLQILYWLDQADRGTLKRIPPQNPKRGELGVFALRSPMRPNPIAISVVELFTVNNNQLFVSSLDCLDGTPLVDIKSYLNQIDRK